MTPTDKLSELLAAATKVQRLAGQYATARSDDDYTAKQCSSARHVYLAALEDFHHVNGEQIIANAAEVIRLRAENAELVAANTRLVVRLEKARGMGQQLVDDGECGYEITQRWRKWLEDAK